MDQQVRALTALPEPWRFNCTGGGCSTQHPHGGPKQFMTPGLGDLMPSCLLGHQACTWCIDQHAGKTQIHIK